MKISAIRTGIVNLPANEPLADEAANPDGKRPIVWVRVGTDSGAEGIGVAYFGGALTGSLRHAIDELGALLVGDDPQLTEGVHAKLKNAAGGSAGPGGIYHLALSALEIDRMRRIREAIGPDIKLMCDINQRWRPEQAMDIGKRVEDAGVGLFWLEDVTTADDYPGLARISDALSTPVAGGEYVWGIVPFRHMMEARSVDVPMVDLVRVGGITQWLKVAGMAEAFNLPVVSHLIPEVHVHLIGAAPNGLTVEYMPWLGMMFKEVPVQQNGVLAMPTKPGLGIEFDEATLERYKA